MPRNIFVETPEFPKIDSAKINELDDYIRLTERSQDNLSYLNLFSKVIWRLQLQMNQYSSILNLHEESLYTQSWTKFDFQEPLKFIYIF